MNRFKKGPSLALVLILLCSLTVGLVSCAPLGEVGEYTLKTYTTALGSTWNPHVWETSGDREIMDYLITPLVSILPLDTEEGSYQWCFEHAESVKDVTRENLSDLDRFGADVSGDAPEDGYVFEIKLRAGLRFEDGDAITAEDYVRSMELLLDPAMKNSRANLFLSGEAAIAGAEGYFSGASGFNTVGIYAIDQLTFRYVTKAYIEYNYFLSSLTSSWLVKEDVYLDGIDESGKLKSTDYNTSLATTVSYGPYKMVAHQTEKEITLVRNEAWYGWQNENGNTVSYTEEYIDGERQRQYMATRVVISVMDEVTARQSFLRGELSTYSPSADEYNIYKTSDKLYLADETYTMSLFFNSNADMLATMDRAKGNTNSIVLSNTSFRRAMSLAIDRAEMAYSTEGYQPVFGLLNDLYHYDIYDDPASVYRESEAAMRAVLRLYNTDYGDGTPYKTLKEAYDSITGYNLQEARELFGEAFSDLTESGMYRAGEDITIRVAWAKGALTSDDNKLVALLNLYLNRAAEGVGFGKITLVPVGQVASRYRAVPSGEFAIGYGAWGGAAFYPFRALLVYLDPEYENLHEAACWSPDVEKLTLTVGADDVTMTYQEWGRSMTGTGVYARADVNTKLEITAKLEEAFLSRYYRIPLFGSTNMTLLSYQVDYFTNEYNVMYGFGGVRLMRFYYDDYEWSRLVRKDGQLEY